MGAAVIFEKEIQKRVMQELEDHRALRVKMKNKAEAKASGYTNLFPPLEENEQDDIRYRQIERALNEALDEVQRDIIERKFLSPYKVKDLSLREELGINKDLFYACKKKAIRNVARALGII